MGRRTVSLVAASVLIAFLCFQAAADEGKAAEKATPKELIFGIGEVAAKQSVLGRLKANLYSLASEPKNQILIAASFLVFGAACLIDGARSFQLLVVVSVGVLTSCFMLTQLGTLGKACSGIAAVEIGVFVAFAALLGWEGTQLLLGLGAGAYLYHLVCGLIVLSHHYIKPSQEPHIKLPHEANNTKVVAGYTVAILVGTFLVNDKGGAQRAFAIIAPLIGAAMVVSTMEFMVMFMATTPQGAHALGTSITIDQLPSVFDYLYMIVFPFHSRPVGYFTHMRSNFNFEGHHIELDKVIGVTLWFVFALSGMCIQCKTISKLKRINAEEGEDSLRARLLEPAAPTV